MIIQMLRLIKEPCLQFYHLDIERIYKLLDKSFYLNSFKTTYIYKMLNILLVCSFVQGVAPSDILGFTITKQNMYYLNVLK